LHPGAIVDADTVMASAIGASLKPALVPSDDAIYAIPSISAAKGTALVVDADAVYSFVTTLFVKPSFVSSDDAIPAADVGWKVFAEITTDADAVFGPHAEAWAYVEPDVFEEQEHLENYPFFVHGVEGGVPVPQPEHLTGSVSKLRVLTGSLKKPIRLTGSLSQRRTLTGSLRSIHYGKGAKKR
jgi:hypothetical protein